MIPLCRRILVPALLAAGLIPSAAFAGEADLVLPSAAERAIPFHFGGFPLGGETIIWIGLAVALLGILFGVVECFGLMKLPAHKSMLDVSTLIYSTCKTYLFQQAKLLLGLEETWGK